MCERDREREREREREWYVCVKEMIKRERESESRAELGVAYHRTMMAVDRSTEGLGLEDPEALLPAPSSLQRPKGK